MIIERPVEWGPLGLITYARTYSREKKNGQKENFTETVERELKGAEKQLKVPFTPEEKKFYRDMRHNMKGSVAGRFMWQLGTKTVDKLGLPSLQNCFSGDTTFVTSEGIKRFDFFEEGDPVLVKGKSSWKKATVHSFGEQEVFNLTVKRGKHTEVIKTTAGHRWNISNNLNKKTGIKTTSELGEGDILQRTSYKTNLHNLKICDVGIRHGLVFGDGHYSYNAQCCGFTPCGENKDKYRELMGSPKEEQISGLPNTWKSLPTFGMNKHYIYGFLAGWFAADGTVAKNGSLHITNSDYDTLLAAKGLFSKLDIYCGDIILSRSKSPFNGEDAPLYKMSIHKDNLNKSFFLTDKHIERWSEYKQQPVWKVVSVESTGKKEKVWCVIEPENQEFTLSNGILTKNCAFTKIDEPIRPFTWTMDMLMLGSGVGYSIKREHVYKLPKVSKKKVKITRQDDASADFIVPDTREGWVKLLGKVLKAHFFSGEGFTYSTQLIRGRGEAIKGFGGVASGAAILVEGMELISGILEGRRGQQLRPIDCLDIMNIIGMIVVAGNVRRSAQIAIGDYDDLEFLKAKRWDLGNVPNWRAMSNNSVDVADVKDLPQEFWDTYEQGEPYGLINIELSRKVGRLGETQYPDPLVEGYNPCAEQSLADKETCALAEVYLPNITSQQELWEVVRILYKIVKHSLALKCHNKETEDIVHKHFRMGIGMTGVMMATEEQLSWLDNVYVTLRQYDKEYSKEHGFPESIKLTTLKPSGTLSLLPGVTPGVHPSTAGQFYIRRIRMASESPLVEVCKSHGYYTEYQKNFDGTDDRSTVVVEFPCKYDVPVKSAGEVDVIDQLELVKRMQTIWSDNSVSVTAYYNKEDLPRVKEYLEANFKGNFKSLSFLLNHGHGFAQAPYEPITEEQYEYLAQKVKPITTVELNEDDTEELGACGLGGCPIK